MATEDTKMTIKDMSENFNSHWETKFKDIDKQDNGAIKTLGAAMNAYAYGKDPKTIRTKNALLEVMACRGLRVDDTPDMLSSTIKEVFDSGVENSLLGIEYLRECFSRNIGVGIGQRRQFATAGQTRGGIAEPFNPPTYDMQVERDFEARIQLRDIIARRVDIDDDVYKPGIIDAPEDTRLTPVSEFDELPMWKGSVREKEVRTQRLGYRLNLSYQFMRNSSRRMSAITEMQRQKAVQVEIAIVDEAVEMIGDGATAFAFSTAPTKEEITRLHMQSDDYYVINTLIGTEAAASAYVVADVFYTSGNQIGFLPSNRMYLDRLSDVELIGKKQPTYIPTLQGNDPVLIAFDRRHCLEYVVPRRGMISESDRNIVNQSIILTNSHEYALNLRGDANRCRWRIVFS